jgi:hypothetical protein
VAEWLKAMVCLTPISISAIFVFPRKSSRFVRGWVREVLGLL